MEMKPNYDTMLFREIFETSNDFVNGYKESPLHVDNNKITDSSALTLYYLLMERYSNNPIQNLDVEQFKMKVYSIIFQYGPTWEKKLEIQQTLRNFTEEDLRLGTKQIHNHSYNPSSEPSDASTEELNTVDDQNTAIVKKSKIEAYSQLWVLLENDVTKEFLDKFQKLFKQFVRHEHPTLYKSEVEDNEY